MEDKVNNTKKFNAKSISYRGKVVVKTLKGKRVIQSRTYHNKGMANLFRYLANALTGKQLLDQVPTYIQLFSIADPKEMSPSKFSWDAYVAETPQQVTVPIIYETTPKIYRTSGSSDSGYTVKYSFRIPFSLLAMDSMYLAGLFPNKDPSKIELSDVLAYYLFLDEDNPDTWKPVKKEGAITNQYSLAIEWIMEIANGTEGGS